MSRRNLTVLFAGLVIGLLCYSRAERNPYARYTSEAYRLVDDYALETPTDQELFSGAIQGMVRVLRNRGDAHSDFLEPRQAEEFSAELRQQFGGIGVRFRVDGDPAKLVVAEPPLPGTPAYGSPFRTGDEIVAVDGVTTAQLPVNEVIRMLRGPVGEEVEVTIRHSDGAQEAFRLVRAVIHVPAVIGDRRTPEGDWVYNLEEDPRLALVRLTNFGDETAKELRAALEAAQSANAEAFILDLRRNPGGAVDVAVEVAELLLPADKPIVSTRGRDGHVLSEYKSSSNGPFRQPLLAVLIDRDTASASEIVAAALQDHDRAVVIGERSFGKGTVQLVLPLEAGRSRLKLTTASYWRPSGVNIHRLADASDRDDWGVTPDLDGQVLLSDPQREAWLKWRSERDLVRNPDEAPAEEQASIEEVDPMLARAMELLANRLELASK